MRVSYKQTISYCSHCYKEIPASISVHGNGVVLTKSCCGEQTSEIVETDPAFYVAIDHTEKHSVNPFGNWLMLPVTNRCNTKCAYCYHDCDQTEPSFDSICTELEALAPMGFNICLTGGEPTVRDDLFDILEFSKRTTGLTAMITNGIALSDSDYLRRLAETALYREDTLWVNVSLHNEEDMHYSLKQRAMENITSSNIKIADLFFTIDSIAQIAPILSQIHRYKHNIMGARIRTATKINNENKTVTRMFLSDIYKEIVRLSSHVEILVEHDNNMYHLNVIADGVIIRLIAWPDVSTIDLMSIKQYGPYIKADNGQICNLLQAQIINEGMKKGFLNGKQYR